MTDTVTLTEDVSYDWDELKKMAIREPRVVPRQMPPVAPRVEPVRREPVIAPQVAVPLATPTASATAATIDTEALIAKISEEVKKNLFEELDLVVELALKKTRAHLRSDLEKAIAINVTRSVKDAVAKAQAKK